MNTIRAAFLLMTMLSFLSSAKVSACEESIAINAIGKLAKGLSSSNHPTIENAAAIVSIAKSCESSSVKTAAAFHLQNAFSGSNQPSISVAKMMEDLCGNDQGCAIEAIWSLANSLSNSNHPTIEAAQTIVEIVRKAPYPKVKKEAISALSLCISSSNHPTAECAAAITEIGQCSF